MLNFTQALVSNGARVYNIDRRADALRTVVELYDSGPGKIIPYVISLAPSIRHMSSDG